jgi:hypothetical protein
MQIKDLRVFVCVPGVGKNYLASIDDRFIDLDREKAIYKYGFDNTVSNFELEKIKGGHGKAKNDDSLNYIKNKIREELKAEKILLLAPNPKVVDIINEMQIPYCLIYCGLDAKEDLTKRMKNRGNQDNFISGMMSSLEKFYKENKEDKRPVAKIELKTGMDLSEIMWNYFGKSENKI